MLSHFDNLVPYVEGPLPMDYLKSDIGVGMMEGHLLCWFKANLIHKQVRLVYKISDPPAVFLKHLFFFKIDYFH